LSANASGGNGTYTYTWASGTNPGTGQSVSANPGTTTTYTVTVTDGCGTPAATDVVTVSVNPLPVLAVSAQNNTGCQPVCADLILNSSPAAASIQWQTSNGLVATNDSTPQFCFPLAGSYGATVLVTDINGCTNTVIGNNLVTVYQVPTAEFSSSPATISELSPIVYFTDASTGSGISSWSWAFDNVNDSTSTLRNPAFTYEGPGTYDVMLAIMSANGCVDTVYHPIIVDPDYVIFIPNAFSPNNDGLNDLFFPVGTGIDKQNFDMWIYDRWGNMIWSTENMSEGWDGKVKGSNEVVMQDVYVWRIRLKTFDSNKKVYTGHVTVVK
jgi:gliding motility-associated-like protein